jgi:RecG-like helicase
MKPDEIGAVHRLLKKEYARRQAPIIELIQAQTGDPFCILVATAKTEESRERLRVLEETNDGFRIAEADLALRGAGELLGQQQSGLPPFRFGDLAKDRVLVEQARALVQVALSPPAGK